MMSQRTSASSAPPRDGADIMAMSEKSESASPGSHRFFIFILLNPCKWQSPDDVGMGWRKVVQGPDLGTFAASPRAGRLQGGKRADPRRVPKRRQEISTSQASLLTQ